MSEYIFPIAKHNELVEKAYQQRGYTEEESRQASRFCELAAWYGIKTHNALKALHLDHIFGSGNQDNPGCKPSASVIKRESPFAASEQWDADKKLGQAVAFDAMETAMKLADQYGVGMVSVDNAFHYLWGGGYVMDAANKGYIAYTNCTSTLAEVVPFMGKFPTLGTNPHSWGFPTTEAIGFPLVIDWATSTVAMGRVQALKREGKQLPPEAAVDHDGKPTLDPNQVAALLPFGRHKGYGLSLINELVAALIGGSIPTIRGRPEIADVDDKTSACFHFQVIHPDALSVNQFVKNRSQQENLQAVIVDILGHGNENCLLPGQMEHQAGLRSKEADGLIFTEAEITEFEDLAREVDVTFSIDHLQPFNS